MATEKRRKSASVNDKLFTEGHTFNFFQATRLLQGIVRQWQAVGESNPVGHDVFPEKENIKFSTASSLKFQSSEIVNISALTNDLAEGGSDKANMQIAFMGLDGPSSSLPVFLTEMEMLRSRAKDTALKDFLEIFNHRLISLFYRAWEKYRLTYNYESHALLESGTDQITQVFEALLGIDGKYLKQSLPASEEELIYYAGLYASPRRSASALQGSLSEFLDVPVKVHQFKGEWLELLKEDRSQLPIHPLKGRNNCLGMDMVIGERFYTVEGKFELEIGPISNEEYSSFCPGRPKYLALKRFTELFVGANFVFDVKYNIESEGIKDWSLDSQSEDEFRLGWNTWMRIDKENAGLQTVSMNCEKSVI